MVSRKATRKILALLVTMSCLLISGCGLTLGPQTKTTYVIVPVGKPIMVLENVTVTARLVDAPPDSAPIKQAIGGWYVLPPDHFNALVKAAQSAK